VHLLITQQKLKEEREAKRAQLDSRHDYILSIVSSCVGLEKAEVEDAILEGTQVNNIPHSYFRVLKSMFFNIL